MTDKYITTAELSELLKIKKNTIERWRTNRESPFKWIKIGGRVLYNTQDVVDYLNKNMQQGVKND